MENKFTLVRNIYRINNDASSVTVIGCEENFTGIATIPNSVQFNGKTYKVTKIDNRAFAGCTGMTKAIIGNSVEMIGESAFEDCSGLTSIVVDSENTKYDSRNNCNAIIETATDTLIAGCKNTIIPDTVTEIGHRAFDGCCGLTSVIIPNSVTEINNLAFNGCRGLTSIVVESGNLKYDSRNNCNAIIETATNTLIVGCKTTVIPESVTEIHDFAFNGCRDLTSVEIPDSVSKIGGWAFNGCRDLTSVEIPDSVEWIGPCAFSGTPWERNRRKEPTKK
ncbi:MAG: leucine-rich repeat domain-containing protein [Muribaculaceae bacterium]|nr:leucine-rich repeat domain-containing protein [Muribaculaceae bacterium]